jgi:hypothetical protein
LQVAIQGAPEASRVPALRAPPASLQASTRFAASKLNASPPSALLPHAKVRCARARCAQEPDEPTLALPRALVPFLPQFDLTSRRNDRQQPLRPLRRVP